MNQTEEEKKKKVNNAFWRFRKRIDSIMEKYLNNRFALSGMDDVETETKEDTQEVEHVVAEVKKEIKEIENTVFQRELSEDEVTEVQDVGEGVRSEIEEAKREYYEELGADAKNTETEIKEEILEEGKQEGADRSEETILADEDEEAKKVIEEVREMYADDTAKAEEEAEGAVENKVDEVKVEAKSEEEVPVIEDESEKKYSLEIDDVLQGKKVPELDEYMGLALSVFREALLEQGEDSEKITIFVDVLKKGFDLYLNSFSEKERMEAIGMTEGRGSVFVQKIVEEFVAAVMDDEYIKGNPELYDKAKKIRDNSRDNLGKLLDLIQEKNKNGESFDVILNFSEDQLSDIEKTVFIDMKQVLKDAPSEMKERVMVIVANKVNEYIKVLKGDLDKIKGK